MKLGIVIYSNDPETVWNAFRLGIFSLKKEDEVKVFLLAKGVESESLDTDKFNVTNEMSGFIESGVSAVMTAMRSEPMILPVSRTSRIL